MQVIAQAEVRLREAEEQAERMQAAAAAKVGNPQALPYVCRCCMQPCDV